VTPHGLQNGIETERSAIKPAGSAVDIIRQITIDAGAVDNRTVPLLSDALG